MAINGEMSRDHLGRIPQIWTVDLAVEESRRYRTKKEFRTNSNSAYQYLLRHGKLSLINLDGKRQKIDQWDIFCAIKKSASIGEFRKKYPSEYGSFKKRKDMINQSALDHMPRSKTAKFWTDERIISEAKKYSHRSEFSRMASGAYDAAMNKGILDLACSHMTYKCSDYDCVYVWTAEKHGESRTIKVGVTSKRLGMTRINFVERKSGFCAKDVIIKECLNALDIESRILSIGTSAGMPDFSGSTEFMIVSDMQYIEIIEVINNEAIV